MKQTDKKILFATRLYYPHIGGVEKHVNKITRELLDKKKLVTIVTELHDTRLKRKEQFQRHTIYRIPVGKNNFFKKFHIWFWFLKNISLIRNADIIHMHDVAYWLLPFKFIFPNKRFYVTFHGYEDYPIRKKWIVQRKIIEQLVDGSICIGEFMKKWYKAEPSKILYGGSDYQKSSKNVPNRLTSLFFGRFEQQTNGLQYAQAVREVKKAWPQFKALFIGDGPQLSKIEKIVDVKPFDPNVEDVISEARYIFVSRYLSMLEALSRRKLIFAYYDTPIKRDYLLSSPFIDFVIPVSNPKKLAEKLMYFSKHPQEERKIVERGYNWSRKHTWKKVAEEYLDLWNTSRQTQSSIQENKKKSKERY